MTSARSEQVPLLVNIPISRIHIPSTAKLGATGFETIYSHFSVESTLVSVFLHRPPGGCFVGFALISTRFAAGCPFGRLHLDAGIIIFLTPSRLGC